MNKVVLFCKSYRQDLLRAVRLAKSIKKYNSDNIPFYLSVPDVDFNLFVKSLQGTSAIIIHDEDIIKANPKISLEQINGMHGRLSQQIVKSEFWRLGLSENYLCLDSDNEFISYFYVCDFINPSGEPYTVISEAKNLLEFCDRYHYDKVRINFTREALAGQELFARKGKIYDFGIPPLIWSAKVWQALDERFLQPQNINFADLIEKFPHELIIYGEALLKYLPITLYPCEAIFKTYYYESQYFFDRKRGITNELITKNYLGIVRQSNWENLHFDKKKNFISRTLKQIKRFIRYLSV